MKKTYKFILTTLALALCIGFSSTAQTARAQIIHNSADAMADSVDVYLGSNLVFDNFAFRTATPFIDLPAGSPILVGIAPKTSTSANDTIATFTFNLTPNETYIIIANGLLDNANYSPFEPFGLNVFPLGRESANGAGNTDLLAFHGSTDAPAVDVSEIAVPAGQVIDNLEYGDFAGYLPLLNLDYRLLVQDSTSSVSVRSYEAPLNALGLQDSAIVVLASGFLDPSTNNNGPEFGLFVALPSGGNLIPLPESTARAQVIHNSPDAIADSVDIYLDGELLLDNFAFRTATPFVDLNSEAPVVIGVAPKTSSSYADTLVTFTYTLSTEESYMIVANGLVDNTAGYTPFVPFNLAVYNMAREAASTMGNTDVLVFHGSTDAPTVDVEEVLVPAGTIVDNLAYGTFAGYLELATNDYRLAIKDSTSTTTVATYDAPLSGLNLQDAAIVVLASGFLNPANNNGGPDFGLYVALPAGGDLVPLTPTVGLTESKLGSLDVYPNPASDRLSFSGLDGTYNYSITDISGRIVMSGDSETSASLNISDLAPGTFFVRVEQNGTVQMAKIIVQ